jgi:hypothetical protein
MPRQVFAGHQRLAMAVSAAKKNFELVKKLLKRLLIYHSAFFDKFHEMVAD